MKYLIYFLDGAGYYGGKEYFVNQEKYPIISWYEDAKRYKTEKQAIKTANRVAKQFPHIVDRYFIEEVEE